MEYLMVFWRRGYDDGVRLGHRALSAERIITKTREREHRSCAEYREPR